MTAANKCPFTVTAAHRDSGWDLFKLRDKDAKTFNRIREAEVIHARWAMLGVISLLLSDVSGSPFPPKEVGLVPARPKYD